MRKNCFNLFDNEIIKFYIDLQYEKAVVNSYNGRALGRDLYYNYKLSFLKFIQLVQKSETFSLLEDLDNFTETDKPDYDSIIETMPWCAYKDQDYNLLLMAVPDSIKNLELERTISYSYLKSQYISKFTNTISEDEIKQLNWDFLTVFSKFYGNLTLSSVIELYVDIIMYEKEFDGISNIESFVFEEGYIPKKHLLKQSINLFLSIVKCYYYRKNINKGKTLLEALYNYMDDNYDTSIIYKEDEPEAQTVLAIPDGIILKSDRNHYNQHIQNLPTNWTFSDTTQVKNAFRLNLIAAKKYNNALKRHEQNELLRNNDRMIFEERLKDYSFLTLKSEEYIASLDIPNEKRIYPEVYFLDELKYEQLAEYKTAFSKHTNIHSINKYYNIRLSQLEKAFQNNEYSAEDIIKELSIISIINKHESICHLIENIKALEILRADINKQLLDKIDTIRNALKIEQKSICVLYDNQYYRFYQSLEYRDALNISDTIIDIAANGGNIDESEWWAWHKQSNNQEITFAASRLEDNRYQKDNKTLVSIRKEDAPLLVNLLEKDCTNFMIFFHENVKPNQTFKFIGAPISKLMTAYITTKDYERAIYWADEFLKVVNKYNPPYPGCNVAEILNKKEKCIQYLFASDKTVIKNENSTFLLFEEAREFARSLKLKSENEWREYKKSGKKPDFIPAKPEMVYKDKGWKGFKDWLGN